MPEFDVDWIQGWGLGLVWASLGRFHEVYGTSAFVLSSLIGVVIGALAVQRIPLRTT